MKPSLAANLSLILVGLGWFLSIYGALSQLGDPSPFVPPAEIQAQRHISMMIFLGGIFFLGASLWLSGYSFEIAKKRAAITLLALVLPFVVILIKSFH